MTTETPMDDEVLTIDEAAAILRISRNAAYTLSRKWRATGGRVGLPCIEIGRSVRVPRSAIRQLLQSATTHDPDDQVA
jgi:predicted DNA-binding transcriptional regulator AlpA